MSKATKARASQKRRAQKSSAKVQRKATYAGYAASGQNKKSKRFVASQKKTIAKNHLHKIDNCGNPGCVGCFGMSFRTFVNKDGYPKGMSQRMFLKWRTVNPDLYKKLILKKAEK